MNTNQEKVFLQTRLRNLKRKASRLSQHADLTDDYLTIKKEIDEIEQELL